MRKLRWAAVVVPALFVLGCEDRGDGGDGERVVMGQRDLLFGQLVESWVELDGDDRLVRAGFTLPQEAVRAAPIDVVEPVGVALRMPSLARDQSHLEYVGLDWVPGGHEPAVFEVPHFDLHYYFLPVEQVEAIDCSDETVPRQDLVPEGYVFGPPGLPPECVPQMGMHAVHESALEREFSETMVLGYYGGELIFLEPMITREALLRQQSIQLEVPVPDGLDGSGRRYPKRFRADWNEDAEEWSVYVTDFVELQ